MADIQYRPIVLIVVKVNGKSVGFIHKSGAGFYFKEARDRQNTDKHLPHFATLVELKNHLNGTLS